MSLVFYVVGIVGFIAWIYLLYVLDRAQVPAWRYIAGSGGLFVFMMVYLRPVLTQPLASLVAACAGLFLYLFLQVWSYLHLVESRSDFPAD